MKKNKNPHTKEVYSYLKHLVENNIRFSILQVKTRRSQELVVLRLLTKDECDKTSVSINGIHVITCYNVRDCLRAIKAESICNARRDLHIKLNPAKENNNGK